MTEHNIHTLAPKAGLRTIIEHDRIVVKSVARAQDVFGFVLGCIISAVFLFVFIALDDIIPKLILLTLGIGSFAFFTHYLLTRLTNFIAISDDKIEVRNNLKRHIFFPQDVLQAQITRETRAVQSLKNTIREVRSIEIIIIQDSSRYKVLHFQMPQKHAKQANQLGNEILELIQDWIKEHES
ncbi:MAG: hypothetical protein AB8F95_17245 [Bacteroidia bacterium]